MWPPRWKNSTPWPLKLPDWNSVFMAKPLTLECLTWHEKLKLINHDGPYHKHPELVEKLKRLGILEYHEIGEEYDFSVAGAAFRDEVYQFVHAQTDDNEVDLHP